MLAVVDQKQNRTFRKPAPDELSEIALDFGRKTERAGNGRLNKRRIFDRSKLTHEYAGREACAEAVYHLERQAALARTWGAHDRHEAA